MRDGATWMPSPNFKKPTVPRRVSLIVIHATETTGFDSPLEWLRSPESNVSAHFLFGKDGMVAQLVDEANVAYHAGVSAWKGMKAVNKKTGAASVNHCSIGHELVNANDGKDPWPQAQLDALAKIVAAECREYGLAICDVVGHMDIAPCRKTDPAEFPWIEFGKSLAMMGIPALKTTEAS